MRLLANGLSVLVALLSYSVVNGAQIFFSQVGPPVLSDPQDDQSLAVAPAPLTVGDVPQLIFNVGETASLHVWLQPDEPPPNQVFDSLALDVVSSNASVASPVQFTWVNPFNRALGVDRWDYAVVQSLGAPGTAQWVQNAKAQALFHPGIGKRAGTGLGDALFASDTGRDANTSAFYLGRLDFRITTVGRTGLYFRNGEFQTLLQAPDGPIPAPLRYGDSSGPIHQGNVAGAGDPITPDLALADAIITVCGGAPEFPASILAREHDGTDVTSGGVRLISAEFGEFRSAGDAHSGRINVADFVGDRDGNLTLYFDLVDDWQAEFLVSSLNQAFDRDYEASLSNFRGRNFDTQTEVIADIAVTFFGRGSAGANQFIDFNFVHSGSCGPGEIFAVRAIGVPEPSAWWLAAPTLPLIVARKRLQREAASAHRL
jgi:hypothetical protein